MKDNLNIITILESEVVFDGFEHLTNPKITIKTFGNSLVIIPEELPPLYNRFVFELKNKRSADPQLIKFLRMYCEEKSTVFVEMNGAYYQAKDIKI